MQRLRTSEWLIAGYFTYVALVASFFIPGWKPWAMVVVVAAAVWALSRTDWILRDLAPMAFVLAAYRQMDWFSAAVHDHHLERAWVVWDRWLLDTAHVRGAIESLGTLMPSYFELCYLLVYTVAPLSIAIMILGGRRSRMDTFWTAYLAGTLGAYALFPYFPSDPPRTVFVGSDLPHIVTALRRFNLWIVGGYGIHSSVFPSAHVSSALSAAWGLLAAIPERKQIGRIMAFYAASVSIATVYGRYHYAIDAAAGVTVSLLGLLAVRLQRRV